MADWRVTSPAALLKSHLNRVETTRRAYADDLQRFADWLKVNSAIAAVKRLVGSQRGEARRILEDWKGYCRARGLSLATTRRRLSSLLGLLALAHEYDVIPWAIRLKLPAAKPVRDTRGPGRFDVERMLTATADRGDVKGARDHAIMCLLYFSALRASEVLSIDLAGVDLQARTVVIKPKGHWDKQTITIPMVTEDALTLWLKVRGNAPGPLFTSLRPGSSSEATRLSYRGLYGVVVATGRALGLRVWPHALRHSAATEIENLSGSVGMAMALTRHKDPRAFFAYRDKHEDMRSAAEILAAGRYVRYRDGGPKG